MKTLRFASLKCFRRHVALNLGSLALLVHTHSSRLSGFTSPAARFTQLFCSEKPKEVYVISFFLSLREPQKSPSVHFVHLGAGASLNRILNAIRNRYAQNLNIVYCFECPFNLFLQLCLSIHCSSVHPISPLSHSQETHADRNL